MSELQEPPQVMLDRLLHEGKVAVIFLTRLPLRVNGPVTAQDLAASAPFFPLAGAGLGLLAALVFTAAVGIGLPAMVAGALAIGSLVLITGALHEDGLADLADGLGGGTTPAARLEIMRDPRLGSFGVLALSLTLLLRVTVLGALATPFLVLAALLAAGTLSRAPLPVMMAVLPAARPDGLAAEAGKPAGGRAVAAVAFAAVLAGLALGPVAGGVALLAAGIVAGLIGALAVRRIGGVTGDVLGAAQQGAEVAVLLVAVAMRGLII
jgi:adenosylcobinamide-GDP ribazoletransferase